MIRDDINITPGTLIVAMRDDNLCPCPLKPHWDHPFTLHANTWTTYVSKGHVAFIICLYVTKDNDADLDTQHDAMLVLTDDGLLRWNMCSQTTYRRWSIVPAT